MSFFDKFATQPKSSRKTGDYEMASIVESLNNILNTKKQYGSVLEDFGIRDLNECSSREILANAVKEEVRMNIEKYEPRVELVDIKETGDNYIFQLSFDIECIVRETSQSLRMVFDSVYNRFKVNSPMA